MRKLVIAAVLLAFFGANSPASAGAPPSWSLMRTSFGVDAQGASWSGNVSNESSFLPGAYLSYSATQGLSLAGTVQRDFARHTTIGKAGFRFLILSSERGQVAVGANVVGYGDQTAWLGITKPTSWESCIRGSYSVYQQQGRTVLWGIAGASYDPDNNVKEVQIGLRYQLVGGFLSQ